MKYMKSIIEFLFGCHHHGISRVFTIAGRTYQVCCDCGAEFNYSLESMSIVQRDISRSPAPCAVVGISGRGECRHAA